MTNLINKKIKIWLNSAKITFWKNVLPTLVDEPLKGVAEEITIWQVHQSSDIEKDECFQRSNEQIMIFFMIFVEFAADEKGHLGRAKRTFANASEPRGEPKNQS